MIVSLTCKTACLKLVLQTVDKKKTTGLFNILFRLFGLQDKQQKCDCNYFFLKSKIGLYLAEKWSLWSLKAYDFDLFALTECYDAVLKAFAILNYF